MNKKELNLFITDIEALHEKVDDENIKSYLCTEFENIKKKHILKNAGSRLNIYKEVEKMLYNNRRETPEVVPINIKEFKEQCDDNVRIERLELVTKKLKFTEGESLLISSLKGHLLLQHKQAIGVKGFIKFLSDTNENYDYCMFLIKLHKLVNKYKNLLCCKLPVRFFKRYYTMIKQICHDNSEEWE